MKKKGKMFIISHCVLPFLTVHSRFCLNCVLQVLFLFIGAVVVNAQHYDYTTPVPILKQINRHNDDGSYSYGYEAADGSFKIETKRPTGEVVGKYGYVDDTGSLREVEYGASRRGFEPAGTGINVAPPTLKTDNNYYRPNSVGEDYDDGQYREDPSTYYKNPSNSFSQKSFSNNNYNSRPSYNPPQQSYNPPQQSYNPPRQQSYNPPQQSYNYNSEPSYNSNYNSYPFPVSEFLYFKIFIFITPISHITPQLKETITP